MAASATVPQGASPLNGEPRPLRPLTPARGVITLYGYGLSVRVDRGHLVVEDGIGATRRRARFARANHGLRRLVVIGADGAVSLAALRWLADQKAAFVMLDREGRPLAVTGPASIRESRLRRAQAVAHHVGTAVAIAAELIAQKLHAQARLVHERFRDEAAATRIRAFRAQLRDAPTIEAIRLLEARAAGVYWACWHQLPVCFPTADRVRVPDHWCTFGARRSPLTNSPRVAVNPANAMLNYLYALLEAEARLAAVAVGLDPALGLMHADAGTRDSLACDLMEPVRPAVDAHVLDWLTRGPLPRQWFFEQRDGHCRLMPPLAERLSATASTWAQGVAPVAEGVASALWRRTPAGTSVRGLNTPLTQRHRREAKGVPVAPVRPAQRPPRLCPGCGVPVRLGVGVCGRCNGPKASAHMRAIAVHGRTKAVAPAAQAKRSATRLRQAAAARAWNPANQPAWLTEEYFRAQVQPKLAALSVPVIVAAIGVSKPYAADVRAGRRRPHPMHWNRLAHLSGTTPS